MRSSSSSLRSFSFCFATSAPTEDDYYKSIPEGIVLEAGGIEVMPDGRVAVGTRRGDIYGSQCLCR